MERKSLDQRAQMADLERLRHSDDRQRGMPSVTTSTVAWWGRIFLCGLVSGVVWYLLSAIVLVLVGRDFLEVVNNNRQYAPINGFFFFAIDLGMGIWAIWLYAIIDARYGSTIKAATMVGFGWWVMKSLQSAKWVGLGFIPMKVALVPLVATLPLPTLAVLAGAWLYGRRSFPKVADYSSRIGR